MSWIFTIIFSGLLFSSNGSTTNVPAPDQAGPESPANATRQDETERFEQTYPLSANGQVRVSNVNGSIVAEAWDRDEFKLVALKTANSKERLSEVEIKVDAKPDSITIETKYDSWKQKGGERWKNSDKLVVDYQLMIPRGAVLNEIETVNGSVTVSDFVNITKVSAVNGTVKATNLRGTAELSTVNGEVDADFTTLDAGSRISLETVNGRANLRIPSDASATIRAESLNGNISNDFGLPVNKGKYVGRDLYGKIGSGDVKVKMSSVNGDLKVSRQNDGRTSSPATNLLMEKDKDDESWDSDANRAIGMPRVNTAKVNKEIGKAIKDSAKVSKAALEEARIEMEKARPEIEQAIAEAMKSADVQNKLRRNLDRAGAILTGMSDASFERSVPKVEKKSETFKVKGTPKLIVDVRGASVKITGWDRDEIKYSISQLSSARSRKLLDISERHDDSGLELTVRDLNEAVNESWPFEGGLTRSIVEIFVPRKAAIKLSTDGEIRLEGINGEIDLKGDEQSINVRDVEGKLHFSNTSGSVRVIGFKGELTAETKDGDLNLEGSFDKLTARGDSGSITVTLSDASNADIDAKSPEIKLQGLLATTLSSSESSKRLRIGSGGPTYTVTTDGAIILRNSNELRAAR
ncbi:MAG TPA: DUF4097 family beta strand repeat-containing protein [Pyrinomonadaceae bacterium]|nr:DUF4097 family beta strand repeat-containing protein [Pyrinomonadaceae bacterium]